MVILSTLVAALSVGTAAQDAELLLGKYTIAGNVVQARLPSTAGTIPTTAPHIVGPNGWKYLLDPAGRIVDKYKGNGGWSEVRVLYDEAKTVTNKTPWHVKVVVFSHSDLFEKTPDGVTRLRRFLFTGKELEAIYQEIARFASMAEAYSGGNLQIVLDVEQENDWMSGDSLMYGPSLGLTYFSPRINTGEYKVEDPIYRGPYNSVLYLHPHDKSTHGVRISGISLAWATVEGIEDPPLSFSHVLLEAWEKQVLAQARERGYRLGSAMKPREVALSFTPAMWRNVAGPPSEEGYLSRMRPPPGIGKEASQFLSDPLAILPSVDRAGLLTESGLDANNAMDNGVASGAAAFTAGSGLLVKPWALDLFLGDLDSAFTSTPLGIVDLKGDTFVTFQLDGPPGGKKAIDLLKTRPSGDLSASQPPAPFTGAGSIAVNLSDAKAVGNLLAIRVPDPVRGEVLQVSEKGPIRQGRIYLHSSPSFKVETHPYLELWVKASNPEAMQVTLHSLDKATGQAFLFAAPITEEGKIVALPPAATPPVWRRVVIDMRQLVPESKQIVAITLDVPKKSAHWERTQWGTFSIDDVTVRTSTDVPATPLADVLPKTGNATSLDPEERALFAANAGPKDVEALLTLLKDRGHTVQANAAMAFQRIREPRATLLLADLSRSVVIRVNRNALDALAHQGTPEADVVMRQALGHHLDDIREKAAEILATRGDSSLAGPFSLLYAARSWQARRTAATAIGKLPGDEAQAILLAFSNDKNPAVRAAFVAAANPERHETVSRLLWIAVNDPSDYVRALTAMRLIESSNEKLRAEGYKALADDSSATRIEVLTRLTAKDEAARNAIAQNFKHVSADVRAAALSAYGRLEVVTVDQLNDVLLDKMPSVQRQLLDVARKKELKLPAEAIESLRSSVDPIVVQRAKEL